MSDDYRAFLIEIAESLRERESRTLVARRAYDGIAARLQDLAASRASDNDVTGTGLIKRS